MSQPLIYPTYTGPASSWQLVDWLDDSWTSDPAVPGSGTCTITLPQLDPSVRWNITRAVVSTTSATPSTVRFYRDAVGVGNLRSGTDRGSYDEADYPKGLMLPPASLLVAVFSGVSDGAVATLALQAEILRLAGT